MKGILFLVFLLFQSCFGFSQSRTGVWQGHLRFGSATLPFLIHLIQDDGVWRVTADSPKQGVKDIQGEVTMKEDSLYIRLQGGIEIAGTFVGEDTIESIFKQSGVELPLKLIHERSLNKSGIVIRRPQAPHPPYGYDTLDVSVLNSYDNISLAGTMTFPRKKGRYPAVVLLTGSGAQNRNEELFGHQPFKVLADYLTKQGIVVLRFDDRGVGQSGGVFETSTIENFSKDAISAIDFLKKQKQVDPKRIGVIGHSEGGLIAELLAGQRLPDLAFIVSLAGPSISIDKLLVEQLYAIGKASGMSTEKLAKAREINRRNFAIVKGDLNTTDAYQALVQNMEIEIGSRQDNQLRKELMTMLSPAYRYFVRIEPEKYLSKITIPMFAAFGSNDVQVPANVNLKSLFDLVPNHPRTVLKEYEGLNHLFQTSKTGQVSEYSEIEETISEVVLKDMADWINKF